MKPSKYLERAQTAYKQLQGLYSDYEHMNRGRIYHQRYSKYVEEIKYYLNKIKGSAGENINQWVFSASKEIDQPYTLYSIWLPASWNNKDVEIYLRMLCETKELNFRELKTDSVQHIITGEIDLYK